MSVFFPVFDFDLMVDLSSTINVNSALKLVYLKKKNASIALCAFRELV